MNSSITKYDYDPAGATVGTITEIIGLVKSYMKYVTE